MRVENTAEGGTNGSLVTVANSGGGSGTAWTTVSIGLTAAFAYDTSTAGYGSTSYRTANGITLGANYVAWDSTVVGAVPRMYGRMYVRLSTGGYLRELARWRSGATQVARLRVNTSGALELRTTSGGAPTTGGVGSVFLAANIWYRIEWDIRPGSTQTNTIRLYAGHSTAVLETITGTGDFSTATTINEQAIGQLTTAVLLPDMWLDSIVATDVGWPGPALVTGAAVRAAEPGQARPGSGARSGPAGRGSELDAVRPGAGRKMLPGSRPVGTEVARPGAGLRTAVAGRVLQAEQARPGAGVRTSSTVRAAAVEHGCPGAGLKLGAATRASGTEQARSGAGVKHGAGYKGGDGEQARPGTVAVTIGAPGSQAAEAEMGRPGGGLLATAAGRGAGAERAMAGTGRVAGAGGTALEGDTAEPGTGQAMAAGSAATELGHARPGTGLTTTLGVTGRDREQAHPGSGTKLGTAGPGWEPQWGRWGTAAGRAYTAGAQAPVVERATPGAGLKTSAPAMPVRETGIAAGGVSQLNSSGAQAAEVDRARPGVGLRAGVGALRRETEQARPGIGRRLGQSPARPAESEQARPRVRRRRVIRTVGILLGESGTLVRTTTGGVRRL